MKSIKVPESIDTSAADYFSLTVDYISEQKKIPLFLQASRQTVVGFLWILNKEYI